MNTEFDNVKDLEQQLAKLQPLVKRGFEQAARPSLRVEEEIRQAARQAIVRRQALQKRRLGRMRLIASVAATLLLGGALYLYTGNHETATTPKSANEESIATFANLLLDIQGLSEDGFFRLEESEGAWL